MDHQYVNQELTLTHSDDYRGIKESDNKNLNYLARVVIIIIVTNAPARRQNIFTVTGAHAYKYCTPNLRIRPISICAALLIVGYPPFYYYGSVVLLEWP